MKSFLFRLIIFSIPILVILTICELLVRENSLKYQKSFLKSHSEDIEVLILGTSQNQCALNPQYFDKYAASLASPEVALNTSSDLLEKSRPELSSVKYIIIELSLAYLDYKNEMNWSQRYEINMYFDLYPEQKEFFNNLLINSPSRKYYFIEVFHSLLTLDFDKYNQWGAWMHVPSRKNEYFSKNYQAEELEESDYLAYLKNDHNRTKPENYEFNKTLLHKLITTASNNDITIIFLSPPKHHLYNNILTEEHITRRDDFLNSIPNDRNVVFWNYERWHETDARFFINANHMNPNGAKAFTEIVNSRLNSLEK